MKPLYKTTIVIWTADDPRDGEGTEIDALAEQAMNGDAYCSKQETHGVPDPAADPDWEDTDFFGEKEEVCPNFIAGITSCECDYCSMHEPCDECDGTRSPEERHERHCSLHQEGQKVWEGE